jgi:hypothetical protein
MSGQNEIQSWSEAWDFDRLAINNQVADTVMDEGRIEAMVSGLTVN